MKTKEESIKKSSKLNSKISKQQQKFSKHQKLPQNHKRRKEMEDILIKQNIFKKFKLRECIVKIEKLNPNLIMALNKISYSFGTSLKLEARRDSNLSENQELKFENHVTVIKYDRSLDDSDDYSGDL
jgi:hypothetical protein